MRIEFERVSPESVGIHSQKILELLDILEQESVSEIHSIMLSRYGKVFTEGWWSPFAPGIPHAAWSLSKTYTATAVGLAIHEGLLSLDDRMVDILPEYSPKEITPRLNQMTIRNMLKMSSGISDEVFGNDENWVSTLMHSELTFDPGDKFSYVSNGTSALGVVIAKLTGMSMRQYLNTHLFEKIGVQADNTDWIMLPDGSELGAGGLHCTTEDTLRLMMLYEQGGVWNGERLLDEAYVKEATSYQIATVASNRVDKMPSAKTTLPCNTSGYGYQIWMGDRPHSYAGHGAQGQLGIVYQDKHIVVSLTQIVNGDNGKKCIFECLNNIADTASDEALPENPEVYQKLRNRLSRLAMPAPEWAPNSAYLSAVDRQYYKVTDGKFTFYPAFEPRERRGTGFMMTHGIDRFRFSFSADQRTCTMHFEEDGLHRELSIALDGSRRHNILKNPHQVPSELLMSAFWEANTFVLRGRWLESTSEKEARFTFSADGKTVKITCKNAVGSMGAFALNSEAAFGSAE